VIAASLKPRTIKGAMPVDVQIVVAHDQILDVDGWSGQNSTAYQEEQNPGPIEEHKEEHKEEREEKHKEKYKKEQLSVQIEAWAQAVVKREKVVACSASKAPRFVDPEICIRVVDENESQQLNALYRGKDKPTNVLSFPAQLDAQTLEQTRLELLGDIVICAGVIAQEAREQGKSLLDHFAHMVVHGMLHLYGYDHENRAAADEMESIEREILDRFGVNDPYQQI